MSTFPRQINAEFFLGQIWTMPQPNPSHHMHQTQVTTCTKPSEFFQIITDNRQVIHRIEIVNEHMIEVFHNFQEVCDPVQTNVNIFIACFTTSYA